MTTQQAYVKGFVKRANEYGFNKEEAHMLFKDGSQKYHIPESQMWHKHLEQRAYQAAKGTKEVIHPSASGVKGALSKLKALLRKK